MLSTITKNDALVRVPVTTIFNFNSNWKDKLFSYLQKRKRR